MEFLFEIIGEAIFELLFAGGEYAVKSSRTPRPIRILLAVISLLFFLAVVGLIIFAGVTMIIESSLVGGIIILAVAVLIILAALRKILRAGTRI